MSNIVAQFFSSIQSLRYVFPDGSELAFIGGRATVEPEAIFLDKEGTSHKKVDWINQEIKSGHPHISVRVGAETIDSKLLDPMEAIRDKLRGELEDELRAKILAELATKSSDSKGAMAASFQELKEETDQKPVLGGIGTSRSIAPVSAGNQ